MAALELYRCDYYKYLATTVTAWRKITLIYLYILKIFSYYL